MQGLKEHRAAIARLFTCLVVTMLVTACSPKNEEGTATSTAIQNTGSDTMVNVAQVWSETYRAVKPSVSVEVKDRLKTLGTKLSGGQQQRLTIARALSHEPEILCLDEFSIAVDPVTTVRIEDVLLELKKDMTIILVTNLVQQARRLGKRTAFINKGELVEVDDTDVIFSEEPKSRLTYEYVQGIFG